MTEILRCTETRLPPRIRLSMPASGNNVQVARATAAAVAARSGLAGQDIEDVRIAVTELAGALMHAEPRSDIDFEFRASRDEFVATAHANVTTRPHLNRLARRVLTAVVDGFDLWESGGLGYFRATKQASA